MSSPTLSIIILNWNTAELLRQCLASIRESVTLDHEVIVVDNASTDESVTLVRKEYPEVELLVQAENVGFSQGNNAGLAVAQGAYLLLLNPDTQVRAGALETVIAFMEERPEVGMAGPTIWNADGSLQRSTRNFPTVWNEFLRQTMLYRLWPAAERMQNRTHPVDAMTGAALCVRRSCYEAVGPLDPQMFMFFEDTDWCLRAARAGYERWFVACSGVVHLKAAASSRLARTRTLLDSQRSAIYYFDKHYGRHAVRHLRWISAVGASLRGLRALLLWLAGRKRTDQRARLRAYSRILGWALLDRALV